MGDFNHRMMSQQAHLGFKLYERHVFLSNSLHLSGLQVNVPSGLWLLRAPFQIKPYGWHKQQLQWY